MGKNDQTQVQAVAREQKKNQIWQRLATCRVRLETTKKIPLTNFKFE